MVEVLVPVLDRPHRIAPFGASLRASLTDPVRKPSDQVRTLFLCTEGDKAELAELRAQGARYAVLPGERRPGDYARKINLGVRSNGADWFFLAADDLAFQPGWLEACLAVHEQTGALVIGTADLGNPMVRLGMHSTHTLVHRDYLEQGTIDDPTRLLHEGYDHNCVDVEFVETAMWRQVWAFAAEARVEHLHPLWRKAQTDGTYRLGQTSHLADMQLLRARWHLWQHDKVRMMMQRSRRRVLANGRRVIQR
jgi:hypothetical protein